MLFKSIFKLKKNDNFLLSQKCALLIQEYLVFLSHVKKQRCGQLGQNGFISKRCGQVIDIFECRLVILFKFGISTNIKLRKTVAPAVLCDIMTTSRLKFFYVRSIDILAIETTLFRPFLN